jgi:hypothetical protein
VLSAATGDISQAQAKEVAGDKNVHVIGGASTANQACGLAAVGPAQ